MVSNVIKNKIICKKKLVWRKCFTPYEVENEIRTESGLNHTQRKPHKKRNKECESMDIVV